jgi:hypothetical protein
LLGLLDLGESLAEEIHLISKKGQGKETPQQRSDRRKGDKKGKSARIWSAINVMAGDCAEKLQVK